MNERVTPDRAVEEIYDRNGLTEAEAGDFVAEKKAEAEKLYTEASNEPVTRNTGEGLSEFAQRKAEHTAKVEGLKRNLDKWNQIEAAAERRNMTKTGAELTAIDLDARERDIKRQTEERVDELAKKLGDVEKVYDISEVTNHDALAELRAGRTIYGWYDKKKDKVVLYMPNVTDPGEATRTIIHEQVIHRGLSKMFGEDYDNVLAEVYDKVMTPSEQQEFYGYVNGPKKGKAEDIRKKQLEAADEWIAGNYQNLRFKQYNVWDKIVSSVRGILRKNGFDVDYTRRDIENLVRDSYRNLETGGVKEGDVTDVAGNKEREGIMLRYYDKEVNDRFNEELEQQINGTLPRGHIYQMGMPGTVLRACGFPDMPIEMSSTNLAEHARKTHHPFELKDVKDLVRALQEPVAVFAYGNKDKSQNVIAEIQKDGKNFLIGIHFNQSRNGLEVSSIRGIFPKDNAEWLNWVSQGKTLYLDKEKIQALIDQQRKTLADVEYLDLDSVAKLVNDFENPKLSEEENASTEQDLTNVSENGTRFSKSNENQRIFVSNAEKAVEGIKQEKGTPEQWLKMIEKGGGLKAGEDKWMGLSDWLKEHKGKSITKQEVLDFIRENQIQIEEVKYGEANSNPAFASLKEEYDQWLREEGSDYAWKQLTDRYGDDAEIAFWDLGGELAISNEEAAAALLGENVINSTRLEYTTEGLNNNREIALTVPSIEPYNSHDEIHFGDAGGGRAIAWVRFGETYSYPVIEHVQKVTDFHEPYKNANQRDVYKPVGGFTSGDYVVHEKGRDGNMIYVAYINDKQLPVAHATLEEARNAMNEYYKEHPRKLKKAQRVLVIDEIQSKRHQDGRENGYQTEEFIQTEKRLRELESKPHRTEEENREYRELMNKMDGMLRENPHPVPDAPFAKNWHELAMKRMLKLAAEEGYDKIAWTKGEQQAERYNIGESVKNIEVNAVTDAETGEVLENEYDVYTRSNSNGGGFITEATGRMNTEQIHEIFGKDLGGRIIEGGRTQSNTIIEGDDLRIGGEGMKGFYDKMLPSFMNKYGKKWGTKVGEVELPDVEEAGRTMWSVDVTPEMKESVMQGQTMFSKARETDIDKAFNEKLSTLNDENKDKIVFDLGRPSKILLDAGVSDKPMKLYGNKVIKKQKKHGFDLSELKDLPSAIADPIAVFDNYNNDVTRSILTELHTEQGNVLAAVSVGKGMDIDVNIIRSVFGKGEENLFDWLKRGMATYINEKKTLDFLHHSDLLSEALKNQESSSDAAKLNKIGELNKLLGEKLYVRTKNFKDWFGDWEKKPEKASQAVGENGEPLMLWHETGNDFTVFNPRHEGAGTRDYLTPFGIFLKPSPSPIGVAREGEAKQMALYANIRNPIEFANRKELDDYLRSNCEGYAQAADAIKDIDAEYGKRLDDAERIENEAMMDIYRNHPEIWNDDAKRMEAYEKHSAESTRILEEWKGAANRESEALKEITDKFFRNSGHDGIVLKNDEGSFGRKTKTYIAFHPNQVKSATGNVGTFSRENDDIRFSKKRFYDGMSAEEVHDMMGEHAEWSSGPSNLIRELEKHYKGELVSASSGARHAMREGLMPVPGGKYSGQDGEYHHIEFRGKDGETYVESVPFVPAESAGERAGTLFSKSMQAVEPSSGTMFSVRPLLGDKNLHKGLRELKEGEKSHVERVFTENKNFEFSSMNKVESYSDIAYIFRQLEDEAIENSFAVLVKKGKPTVIHLGTGNYTATMVSNSALNVAVNRVNPDKIYFVHNHPSGKLKASRQDEDLLSNLRNMYGPKVADGIIINARSGRYGIYTPSSLHTGADYDVNHGLSDTSNARPIKVYSFSKQVFSPDYQPDALITSSDDVAKFVSSHRLGDRQKLGLIISNNKGAITGNIFLPYSEITKENARDIANDIAYYTSVVGGTRAFMFGNVPLRDVAYKGLSVYVKGFSDLHLLDYVEIDGGRHKSASDEGIRFRFAKTPEEFESVQKEAVEKKGIVTPGLKDKVLNVVDVPKHDFTGSLKDARAEARKWAKDMYHGKEFELPDDGGRYIISNTAIDKYLDATAITNSDNAGIHLAALKELPQIISQSIDAEVHPDYKKSENGVRSAENGVGNNGLLVHRMYGAINIDGETYRVKTTMHEFLNKSFPNTPHSYEVTKIELIESSTADASSSPLNVSTNSISAAKLLNGVEKSYDKGKKLLDESETLTPVNKNAAFRKDYKAEKAQTEDRLLKGNLRETLGKGYTGFVRNLWEDKDNPLYKEMHAYVNKEMQKNGFDINKGVESFLVSKIGSKDRVFWENVRDAYAEGMKKAGNDWKPNLVDVQYGLWLSSKKGNMKDPLFKAEAIAMRDKIVKNLPPVEVVDGAYVDTDTRFRKPVLTPAAEAARDEYDRRIRSQVSRSREAFIDSMESLRVFQEAVGGKDVEDMKNAYVRQNQESSIAHVEWEKYQERINKPLSHAVDRIITILGVGGRDGMKQITDYMIQKHGLERNRVMYVRDTIRSIADSKPKKAEKMQ